MTGIEMIGKLIAAYFETGEKTEELPSLKDYMELYAKLRVEEAELKAEIKAQEAEELLEKTRKENEELYDKLTEAIKKIRQYEEQEKAKSKAELIGAPGSSLPTEDAEEPPTHTHTHGRAG